MLSLIKIRYQIYELFFQLRMRYLFYFFKYFLNKKEFIILKEIFTNLNTKGYYLYKNYYDEQDLKILETQADTILDDLNKSKFPIENIDI